jgi:hypothetical protein
MGHLHITGIVRAASLSKCGSYRWTLTRVWGGKPPLVVVMFNPSTADHQVDDPTINLLIHIAAHNGYGGIVVVNGIPLRSAKPAEAIDMVNTWAERQAWDERDALQVNLAEIQKAVGRAGAVLLAWGALADSCFHWFEMLMEDIENALPQGVPVYCLGKTKNGWPKHPLARGKHKVPKNAPLVPWRD